MGRRVSFVDQGVGVYFEEYREMVTGDSGLGLPLTDVPIP